MPGTLPPAGGTPSPLLVVGRALVMVGLVAVGYTTKQRQARYNDDS
jgi:hypothetical protein